MQPPSVPSIALNAPPPPARIDGLPLRTIPGSYGLPVVGPLSDRLNYFWFQGPETFFRMRVDKYKSTVFRTNVPPCFPFFAGVNPSVIALLDSQSFSHLFDMEIVDKKNILVGDFMPSLKFTGGVRVCAYLDPTEEDHAKVKSLAISILKKSSSVWVSSLMSSLDTMWTSIDESMSKDGKASILFPLQKCLFTFLSKSIVGADPASYSPKLAESGSIMLDKWLALQLLPTIQINAFQPLVEIFLHSFSYPFWLVKGDYEQLTDFIAQEGKEVIQWAETEFGLSRETTIHNLLFILGFNAYGGFSVFLPMLINILGTDSSGLQDRLREEVREKCGSNTPSFKAVQDMPLVKSFVYETLRLNPPVPLQYGRAKKDFLLKSHDAVFEVKRGELLCGYQKLAMMDPKVFYDPETFNPDRFVGEKGQELLNYLYWSNGPQTGEPSPSNKQCPGMKSVILTACLLVAHLFQRYDYIKIDSSGSIVAAEKAKWV